MASKDITLNPSALTRRDKLVLAGLYFSKYDVLGLDNLGFEGFQEAFNVVGFAMGSRPATIKNYRDEFDPLYPNPRRGWHKRATRDYCLRLREKYDSLDFKSFTGLIESFVEYDANMWSQIQTREDPEGGGQFAKRLITGLAAEQYFESVWSSISEFKGCVLQNTTRLGCGYDSLLSKLAESGPRRC